MTSFHTTSTLPQLCDVVAPLIEYSFNLNSNYGQLMHDLLNHLLELLLSVDFFNECCKALNFLEICANASTMELQ